MPRKDSWVQRVMANYASTNPPKGIFTTSPDVIADAADVEGTAPKGLTSWQRMVLFHMNRGGASLAPDRQAALKDAIKLLSERRQERSKSVNGYHEGTLLPRRMIRPEDFAERLGEQAG